MDTLGKYLDAFGLKHWNRKFYTRGNVGSTIGIVISQGVIKNKKQLLDTLLKLNLRPKQILYFISSEDYLNLYEILFSIYNIKKVWIIGKPLLKLININPSRVYLVNNKVRLIGSNFVDSLENKSVDFF